MGDGRSTEPASPGNRCSSMAGGYYQGLDQTSQMLTYARQWVDLEPYDEAAHRALMLALALKGQWEAARQQYEICPNLFAKEMGVEPDAQTETLCEYISAAPLPDEYATSPVIQASWSKSFNKCPYRGLTAFRETHAAFFFGRDVFINRMQTWVRSNPAFTVILGPSGSGKSSVVYAGLMPVIRENDHWLIAEMRPGSDPFKALSGAFQALEEPFPSEPSSIQEVRNKPDPDRFDLCGRVLELSADSKTVVLTLDQFEELYTLCPDMETRRHFLNELLSAVALKNEAGHRLCLALLPLRADFMGQALSYRPFAGAVQGACLLLEPMNRDELRVAIQKPAEIQGVAFESGLVDRLLDDVGEEPGNLPLLEFALTLLWERSEHGILSHAYEEIGRVKGALASYADVVLNDLSAKQQEHARLVFL